ncbi:hypothetical protein ACF0H5_005364 [Mactra antiquata]
MSYERNQSDRSLESRLKRALATGDVLAFKRLIKGGVNVNSSHWFNSTLLHEAVQIGSPELVKVLLQNKANVNSKNNDNRTPLHIASRGGLKDVVILLLQYGADVNARTLDNQTPLYVAAWRKKYEIVKLLVEAGADVNVKDKVSWLALHWVLRNNNEEMVEYLINAGSQIDHGTGSPMITPFHEALTQERFGIAKILLTHGAESSLQEKARAVLNDIFHKPSKLSISSKLNIASFVVTKGLVIQTCDLLDFVDTLNKDEEKKMFTCLCSSIDFSLQNLCRQKIRDQVKHLTHCQGKSICRTIQKLPIPKMLIEYLLYDNG